VNVANEYDGEQTAMIAAALNGHASTFATFLECERVEVNAGNELDCTALHVATQEGHESVIAKSVASN
jgi:hypothetical protein